MKRILMALVVVLGMTAGPALALNCNGADWASQECVRTDTSISAMNASATWEDALEEYGADIGSHWRNIIRWMIAGYVGVLISSSARCVIFAANILNRGNPSVLDDAKKLLRSASLDAFVAGLLIFDLCNGPVWP